MTKTAGIDPVGTDTPRSGADIVGHKLASAGCRLAFGIPGGEVLALMEALDKAGLRFVLVKHENAGGIMAEGAWHADAREKGRSAAPGVLLATLGPGVANAINVVANAEQDRVPLIFLTGCVDDAVAAGYTHQVFDHAALLRPIVKGSFRVASGAVGAVMEKAIALALEGQPGPVHVDVPISVAQGVSDEPVRPMPTLPLPPAPAPGSDLAAAKAALARAARPLAIAGVDAVNEGAGSTIAAFCRAQGVPLITTYKAKGLLPETDPLALGGAGLSPKADEDLMPLIGKADCVLLLGYDPIEMRIGWRDPWADDATVIDITPVTRTHGMHRADITFIGGIVPTLAALDGPAEASRWRDGEPASTRAALQAAFAPEPANTGFGPGQVIAALAEVMPENTVATADSGAHRILASQMWPAHYPRAMLQSSALCTMGCALPLGLGHAIVEPDRPTVVFVGDACLEMTMGEFATVRDLGARIILAVFVDESLALIEKKQRSSQRANLGVDFGTTDFPAIAKAYGGHGIWIDDVATLKAEAKAALSRGTFTVLACRIGQRAYDGKI